MAMPVIKKKHINIVNRGLFACVCVCVRESDTDRDGQRETERQ